MMNNPIHSGSISRHVSDDAGFIDMSEILGIVWRKKLRIFLGMLLGGAVAYTLVSRIEPTYTATSQVILDPRYSFMADMTSSIPSLTLSDSVVSSETSILRSNLLLARVVETLNLQAVPEYNPGLVPSDTTETFGVTSIFGSAPSLEGSNETLLDYPVTNSLTPGSASDPLQAAIIRQLQGNLSVVKEGISYVISITAASKDPDLAAAIANTIADAYIERQAEMSRSAMEGTTNWLDDRVGDLGAQVATAENAVEAYKAENLSLEGGSNESFSQQIVDLIGGLAEARARQVSAQARYEQINDILEARGVAAAAAVSQSPLIDTLRAQRADLQRQNADLANIYDASDPRMGRARADLLSLDHEIAAETRRQVDRLRSDAEVVSREVASLEDSLQQMETRSLELAKSGIQLRQLEREATATRDVYESMLGRLRETKAIEEVKVSDAQIIARASPPVAPSAPSKGLLTALGVMLGGAVIIGFVFLRELRSPRYRTTRELSADTGLPVLTALPRIGSKDPARRLANLILNPQSDYAERIRRLRNELLRQCEKKGVKSIMLTSALSGEGKTTTVLALAHVASLMSKRVIVIDADLRRPSLGSLISVPREFDLAAVLAGEAKVKDAIVENAVVRNMPLGFDILPTWKPNYSAAELLSQPCFREMLHELERDYDLVLIDAPPTLSVSDASVISAIAGLTVIVARAERTPAAAVREAVMHLRSNTATSERGSGRIAGAVLTMQNRHLATEFGKSAYKYETKRHLFRKPPRPSPPPNV